MKRTISSTQTFLVKFIAPALTIIIIGGFTFSNFFKSPNKINSFPLPFIFIFIPAVAFTVWFSVRIKKVSVDGKYLYISNYLEEISIPLTDIYDITEIVWLNGHPVTIHLKHPSAFGNKILFMPKLRPFAFFSSHPIVSELNSLANSNSYNSRF